MSQPNRWWLGLIAPLLLWIAASFASTGPIEADLATRAQAGSSWARPVMAGRDAMLEGSAPSADAKARTLESIDAITGVRLVGEGSITILAEAKPYRFEAARDGSVLTLSGFYPDDATHTTIVDAARKAMPDLKIKDEMALARGVPAGFAPGATFALSQLGVLASGNATLVDQTYSISGVAPNTAVYSSEIARAKSLPAGLKLASAAISPPVQKPYTWSAARDGATLTLSGFVPGNDVRSRNIEAAKLAAPGATIVDKQFIAAGEPRGFDSMASYALAQLARFSKGVVALDDGRYSINGEAANPQALEAALAATKTLPVGFTLGAAAITPPVQKPFTWEARKGAETILLNGYVPSQDDRSALLAAIKSALPSASVTDNLVVAAGAPKGFREMASAALAQLARLIDGSAAISDGVFTISGSASDAAGADAAIASAKILPPGFGLGSAAIVPLRSVTPPDAPKLPPAAVTPPPPALPASNSDQVATCRKEFGDELQQSAIYFDTGKDTFRQVSFATLDRLIETAKKCPDVNVEIAAHTDSEGNAASNQELSERRALAVLNYLKDRIDIGRYRAAGYGETKPIASNATEDGKQKNRRVEFDVK